MYSPGPLSPVLMPARKGYHHGKVSTTPTSTRDPAIDHVQGVNGGSFSISTNKFSKVNSSILKNNYLRLAGACVLLIIILWCFPSFRSTVGPTLGIGATVFLRDDPRMSSVHHYDLSNSRGTAKGWEREERILLCAPLRDAAQHLPMFFSHLRNFTYPHHLIDLAFLVSDSKDNTMGDLVTRLDDLQADPDSEIHFGDITIIEKDFGQAIGQSFSDRHGFEAQGPRRKLMARARNWLLSAALQPDHSWVYWRDVDVMTAPKTILEDLMRHNKDIIVPNVWRPLPDWLGGEQPYDLNSWQESETALQLAQTLDEDAVIVEGYAEYATWRPHLAYLRDPYGDIEEEMQIDGIGGVSILAKASIFRAGCHFPAFSFERHAETEGLGKMARKMGFSVIGLPHYVVWHLYEPSSDDLKHMAEMEAERIAREKQELLEAKSKTGSEAAQKQWAKDKLAIEKHEGPAAVAAGSARKGDVAGAAEQGDHDHGGVAGPVAHVGEEIAQIKDPAKVASQIIQGEVVDEEANENGFTKGKTDQTSELGIGKVTADAVVKKDAKKGGGGGGKKDD